MPLSLSPQGFDVGTETFGSLLLGKERGHNAERQWGELDAPVSNSTLSHHLKVLRAAGVTRTRDEGTRCYVHLRSGDLEARFPGLLESVLNARGKGATTIGIKTA